MKRFKKYEKMDSIQNEFFRKVVGYLNEKYIVE